MMVATPLGCVAKTFLIHAVYSDTNSIQITLTTTSNALPGFNASYETVTDEMCKCFWVF